MANYSVIKTAEFSPKTSIYWLVSVSIGLVFTFFGILLVPFVMIFGPIFTTKYLATFECTLTERFLIVKKGYLVRMEKTIPLDKITDMGLVQGPVMRMFGLHRLTIETAGQSGVGALVGLVGIVDAEAFRELVIEQRDAVRESRSETSATTGEQRPDDEVLRQLLASVQNIERLLQDRQTDR